MKTVAIASLCVHFSLNSFAQQTPNCGPPATIILFRTFNIFSSLLHYNLYAGDSLLGRIKIHDVFILQTYDSDISFHATTKAPSLNASSKSNYQKIKTIKYPVSLEQNHSYFVKCGFLNQSLFDYPRQPTIRLIRQKELNKYLKKRFLKKKIKTYLYNEWLDRL